MKRNQQAKCGNCPMWKDGKCLNSKAVWCGADTVTGHITENHVCSDHPDFWVQEWQNQKDAEVEMLRAQIKELEAAIFEHNKRMLSVQTIEPPENVIDGLRFLAVWFDAVYNDAGTGSDTLQQDLRRWADELEAAQQWHDASKPPEAIWQQSRSRDVYAKLDLVGHRNTGVVYFDHEYDCWYISQTRLIVGVAHWRELPGKGDA